VGLGQEEGCLGFFVMIWRLGFPGMVDLGT
jgi:hypothetical protein